MTQNGLRQLSILQEVLVALLEVSLKGLLLIDRGWDRVLPLEGIKLLSEALVNGLLRVQSLVESSLG